MKWTFKEPSPGDMVRVAIGSIYHFGIYVSDDEVIQFGLPPSRRGNIPDSEVEVLAADIDSFLAGGFLEVCEFDKKEKKKNRTPKEIIAYARAKIGTKGYNILYHNCEHFASDCVTGQAICRQTEDLRAMFRTLPLVDVYIAPLPQGVEMGKLPSKERQKEIDGVTNEQLKKEKYFSFLLLRYALEHSLGVRGGKLTLQKESYGGWQAEDIFVSISHSQNALAVAVSRGGAVGVDIEAVKEKDYGDFVGRFFTQGEKELYLAAKESDRAKHFTAIWTAKEALFKAAHKPAFLPLEVDASQGGVKTDSIVLEGQEYQWSVATATPEKVRLFLPAQFIKE